MVRERYFSEAREKDAAQEINLFGKKRKKKGRKGSILKRGRFH